MSTRSAIGFYDEAGMFKAMYCHYDGYPNHVGKILVEHHNSLSAAHNIVEGSQIRNFDHDGTIARFGDGDGAAELFETVTEALDSGFDYAYVYNVEQMRWICFGRDPLPLFHVREVNIPGNEVAV